MPLLRSSIVVALSVLVVQPVRAQLVLDQHVRDRVAAGSETERYLRAVQLAQPDPYPWSVRGFGPAELTRLAASDTNHPWATRLRADSSRLQLYLFAPRVAAIYNSSYPYGMNDGPLWAGRGLTADVRFGFGAQIGPLSIRIDPEAFRAQNRSFELQPNGQTGPLAFGDAFTPGLIDQPQRFGTRPYARLDPGQSEIRLDLAGLAAGFSTSNEFWGPASEQPIILGNNAPGFEHVFLGSSRPIDLWIVKIHGRALWGRLDQSEFSPLQTGELRRYGTGVVGVLMPRGLPGLEIGASRFHHEIWPDSGLKRSDIMLPFILHNFQAARDNASGLEAANQLASVFARWAFPRANLEVYGEFGKDDYNTDIYDVIVEPDHSSSYLLGLQRVWRQRDRLVAFRAELLNSRVTDLSKVRGETQLYINGSIVQGHTERGQVLGAVGAHGGGASSLAVDVYSPRGRWTVEWSRLVTGRSDPLLGRDTDVLHGISFEQLWFGRYVDLHAALTTAVELNRRPGTDVGNVNLRVGGIVHW